ncbi:hypothetical protein AYK26_04445 [Euryarchaeota archaeon SM23-78]|nr:MAG: hypothetical protein AYK26_04445 [Euryarchaeota archaeon SM23-78]
MIEKIIEELALQRNKLSAQISYLEDLKGKGEYIGALEESIASPDAKHYFYYLPENQSGIVIHKDTSGITVSSYGGIKKKTFMSYYKTQRREEKALKRFPFTWPYLEYLVSKERWILRRLKKKGLVEKKTFD